MSAKQSTSAKILAIRAKAGNSNTICPTCGKLPHSPFRAYNGSKIVHGCIDAIHEGQLVTPSESSRWHAQGESLRKAELAHLKTISA